MRVGKEYFEIKVRIWVCIVCRVETVVTFVCGSESNDVVDHRCEEIDYDGGGEGYIS
jgi:hypothetical protein